MKNISEKNERRSVTSRRGGTLMKLLLFLVVFSGVLAAAWVYFLPVVLTSALQKRTGFGVKVSELFLNPFNAKVDVSGFIITNPEGFPRREFIEVTTFNANAKLKTLFSDRPEFDYARIEVAYVALVRDADGVLNAELFNSRMNQPPFDLEAEVAKRAAAADADKIGPDAVATKGSPMPKPKVEKKAEPIREAKARSSQAPAKDAKGKEADVQKPVKPIRFMIRRLELRLEKVIVADYTTPTPTVHEYNCKLSYAFNDVTDPNQLLAPFALKSLQSVGEAIRGLIPGDIGKAMGAATQSSEPLLKEKDKKGEDTLKTVVEKLEETPKP
jgi:hypothetical protein